MSNYLFNSISYMNNYRVFCFSDIEIPKFSIKQNCIHYRIGDLIPTSGYNYMYSSNLLIVDYYNKIIHVILGNKYCELVKISNGELKLYSNSFLYKLIINKDEFKVIDVYGNFLNAKSLEDIIMGLMEYPILEICFIQDNYNSMITNTIDNKELLINNISYLGSGNHAIISGAYKSNNCDLKELDSVNHLKNSIQKESLKEFKVRWFLSEDILLLINEFLLNIRLLYYAVKNDIKLPFTYYHCNRKYYTHVGKISSYIKDFVLNNDEDTINLVLDTIFANVIFEEEYEDFIISTISISIDKLIGQ